MRDLMTPPTVHDLLTRPGLHLRLVGDTEQQPSATDAYEWVHVSDLLDPTPYLSAGLVLLTTGGQLAPGDHAGQSAYLDRLADAGVVGLGFGTGPSHAEVPAALVDAAAGAGVLLFEVPERTPFIAVTRAGADLVAAHRYAYRTWELDAHRALASAALQDDALGSTLAELSRRLGCWVGLCDASGDLNRSYPYVLDADMVAEAERSARTLMTRNSRAAVTVEVGSRRLTLQTVGRAGRLRGVLAVDAARLDAASRRLTATAVAMAGLVSDEQAKVIRGREQLRSIALKALLAGTLDMAREVADAGLGGLPREPVRVAVTDAGARSRALRGYLDVHGELDLFFGVQDEWLVVLLPAEATEQIDDLAGRFQRRFGMSRPVTYQQVGPALSEAANARRRARATVTRADDAAVGGVLATLGPDAAVAARAMLEPLRAHDERHGSALIETVEAWLRHETQHEAAARALGIHRHTVRARIALAERVLQCDLSTFTARAELWTAVVAAAQATDPDAGRASALD